LIPLVDLAKDASGQWKADNGTLVSNKTGKESKLHLPYLPGDEYARRSTLYNHGLSPRESLLIAADSFSFAADAATETTAYVEFRFRSLAALEEAVRRYPGDPEAWYVLGETRMHASYPIGTSPATTFETFGRSIALDSGFAPAYEHMADLAIQLGRPELARRFAATYVRLYPDPGTTSHDRLALLALDPSRSSVEAKSCEQPRLLKMARGRRRKTKIFCFRWRSACSRIVLCLSRRRHSDSARLRRN